jgi:hypothetical protein
VCSWPVGLSSSAVQRTGAPCTAASVGQTPISFGQGQGFRRFDRITQYVTSGLDLRVEKGKHR